jgi:nitrite reductase (NADH) large subunit
MSSPHRLVVIGNGMAGARVVEDVLARAATDRFHITMFGDEPFGNYNRILLSGVLAGTHKPEDTFINPLDWYAEHGVTLHAGERVDAIRRDTREVRGSHGQAVPYDTLIVATGSVPFVPPIDGLYDVALSEPASDTRPFKRGVYVFRTLEDCERMLARAAAVRRAVVVGGGLLGLEAARGLVARGLEVEVVHLMDHLMDVQLDREAGLMLQRSMERLGVKTHLGKKTTALIGCDEVEGLAFADGTTLPADLVVIAAGIRPNVGLARSAGLAVNRGIVVGDDMVTASDRAICAVGECAEHRGTVYGLVAPLWEQTAVLADRLTARRIDATYEGSRMSTRLKVMGAELAVFGEKQARDADDEVVTYAEPRRGIYQKLVVRDGHLAGAILLGDTSALPILQQLFDRGDPLPDARADVLFPARDTDRQTSADLPDDAQVCNCNGVSKGAIAAAVRGGCRTIKAVCEATRAGTGCGSCKADVADIVRCVAGEALRDDPSIHYYVPGVPLAKADLVAAIRERDLRSVSSVFDALADGREDAASKPGLASLLRTIWGADFVDERDARFINDRVHANIQKDRTFSVVPRIYGGVTTAAELRRIADVADKYQVPMVKITGGQRIDLLGIRREQLPSVWKDLGMPSGHAYTKAFRTCKTCVGTEFCRFGVGDSTTLGVAIEKQYQGLEAPAKMKLAVAGCPRNCSEATTKDLGAVAIEGGRWEIYVGGAAGARVRKGDLLATVDAHAEVIRLMGRFMQWYREHARYLERTYDFVERIGIERIRRVVVNDDEGIAATLDADVQRAVNAYVDPWREAVEPVHPAQFQPTLDVPTRERR